MDVPEHLVQDLIMAAWDPRVGNAACFDYWEGWGSKDKGYRRRVGEPGSLAEYLGVLGALKLFTHLGPAPIRVP